MNNKNITIIKGEKKGPTTTIMTGVHGNEKSGIIICNKMKNISIDYGKIIIIYGNPNAIKQNKRFIEKNLNRCFIENNKGTTYEDNRAKEIIKYLKQSKYLIDIHNTTREGTQAFVISENNQIGKLFDVKFIVQGFDNLHPGGSDGFMNSLGKMGICIECGKSNDPYGITIMKKGIINFLKFCGNIKGKPKETRKKQIVVSFDYIYLNKTKQWKFKKKFNDFEKIQKGEIIGYDGKKIIEAKTNCFILFAKNPEKIGDEVFCLGTKK